MKFYFIRRIELWGEGFRFYDLKRLNLPLDRNRHTFLPSYQKSVPAGDIKWQFAIPQAEIDATGGLLNKILYKPYQNSNCNNKKMFSMSRLLVAFILLSGLIVQSCSKKTDNGSGTTPVPSCRNRNHETDSRQYVQGLSESKRLSECI